MTILFEDPNTGQFVDYLWQWDHNREMFVNANNSLILQAEFESDDYTESTPVSMVYGMNGWTCIVPDKLLYKANPITISIVDISDTVRITIHKQKVIVKNKKKPENVVFESNDNHILDYISALNRVQEMKESVEAADKKLTDSVYKIGVLLDEVDQLRRIVGGEAEMTSIESPMRW